MPGHGWRAGDQLATGRSGRVRNVVIVLARREQLGSTFTAGVDFVEKSVIFGLRGAQRSTRPRFTVVVTDSILRNTPTACGRDLSSVHITATKITGKSAMRLRERDRAAATTRIDLGLDRVGQRSRRARGLARERSWAESSQPVTAAGNAASGFASEATGSGSTGFIAQSRQNARYPDRAGRRGGATGRTTTSRQRHELIGTLRRSPCADARTECKVGRPCLQARLPELHIEPT